MVTTPLRQFGLGSVQFIAISSNAQHLVTAGSSGVFVWDYSMATLRHRLQPFRSTVDIVGIFPGNEPLLGVGNDRIIRIWDTQTGELRGTFPEQQGQVTSL
ncbi:MAG TPA: hypothetical protein VEC99_05605, partial [Clostridia bacterium]|nr:hypothetical protein [Clostridia bacterium]